MLILTSQRADTPGRRGRKSLLPPHVGDMPFEMASPPKPLTQPARFFLEPEQPRHRQYEALRAYFAEGTLSADAARRFGYTSGAFRGPVSRLPPWAPRPLLTEAQLRFAIL